MLPAGAVELLPSNTTLLAGKSIVWSLPASEMGGMGAALTVMLTVAVEVPALLSVIFN